MFNKIKRIMILCNILKIMSHHPSCHCLIGIFDTWNLLNAVKQIELKTKLNAIEIILNPK